MEVKIAEKGGFCWGVKRAMDIAMDTAQMENGAPLYTYGPIIHNPQVIEMLEKRDINVAGELDALREETLIIRTHGITPKKRREIKDRGIRIKDATCPLVMKVQSIIKRYARKGFHIIIIGDPNHAEIIGLLGFSEDRGVVVSSVKDVEKLPKMEPVCVVSQTTLDKKKYDILGNKIKEKFPDCVMENTICSATDERQTEVMKLAGEVDAMIVVGGRNSANTTHLAEISKSMGSPTFMVETEEEIETEKLMNYKTIGVAAGASTPNWMIRRVVNKLEEIKLQKKGWLMRGASGLSRFLILSNIYVAVGAAFMTYAATTMMNIKPSYQLEIISFLYFFSMYILNSVTDEEVIRFNDPVRAQFNSRYRNALLIVGGASAFTSLLLTYHQSMLSFFLLLSASVLGLLYSVKMIPNLLARPVRTFRLKDIPSSKDLCIALAWCVTAVLVPLFSVEDIKINYYAMATALGFVFILVYMRCLLFDVRDIQGDRMVGRETIPMLVSKDTIKVMLFVLAGLCAGILIVSAAWTWTSTLSYVLLFSVLYAGIYLLLYKQRIISTGFNCDLVVDGNFIFTGFITYLWSVYY